VKVDITTDAVARSLYLNGPAGLQTIAADLERREVLIIGGLRERLGSMLSLGQVAVRQVSIAGQSVDLFYLAGGGVG
jgi:hypothetical protein